MDSSNPEWRTQAETVEKLIAQLGAEQIPCITAYNKCDKYTGERIPDTENTVRISAKTGEGMDALISKMCSILERGHRRIVLHIPYSNGGVLETLHRDANVIRVDYLDSAIEAEAVVSPELFGKVKRYLCETEDADI